MLLDFNVHHERVLLSIFMDGEWTRIESYNIVLLSC